MAHAADQHVLGNRLLVVDPGTSARRRIVVRAREPSSDNTLVGDPTISGASITIDLAGVHPSSQVFVLPTGVSAASLQPFWTSAPGKGFTYRDRRGENGPVKAAQIRLASGTFRIKVDVDGELGPVGVIPPDDGTSGCVLLTIDPGDSYSIVFGDGGISNAGPFKFKVSRPTQQGSCVPVTTTTSTTSTTTSTIPRPNVWIFGNSIAQLICPPLTADHPEWNVVCVGVGGEQTTTGLPRLTGLLSTAEPPPTVVVIEEGINDAAAASFDYTVTAGTLTCNATAPSWIDTVFANLQGMRDAVRERGGVPIVATLLYSCPVPSPGDTCLALPPDDPGACPNLRCFFDDACGISAGIVAGTDPWADFVLPSGDYFSDLLHPNANGKALLAVRAADAIAASLP